MNRVAAALVLPFVLAACATTGPSAPPAEAPRTPTRQFELETERGRDQIALKAHPEGRLSPTQRAALADLAARWRAAGARTAVVVANPGGGGEDSARATWAAKTFLETVGVPSDLVRVEGYAGGADAPVLAGFETVVAVVHDCGREWGNLSASRNNTVTPNFGCAVTANLAAQIADPNDIDRARPLDPADGGRRANVLGAWRRGEPTASQAETNGSGRVSQVIQ